MNRRRALSAPLAAILALAWIAAPVTADDPPETSAWWVFLSDKGLSGEEERARAVEAALAALTPRARERRERTRPGPAADLLDVGLHEPWVAAVLATGARERHRLRALNALSVDATTDQIAAVARLPCVEAVRPVARARRAEPVHDVRGVPAAPPPRVGPPSGTPDYGHSASQVLPLQVGALHALGLSGAGVLVAVLDTGFDLSHPSLAGVTVVAERDFVQGDFVTSDEPGDIPGQDDHGSLVLSILAGFDPGWLVGPAYGASFLLAKTETIADETPAEEDWWAAAAQWADSLGADVISTSLSYQDWYTYADMDGDTAVITIAADLAVANGIAVVASAGNQGAQPWFHIAAPADGDSVLTIGATDSLETLAVFSSRGPTFDGRTKPDVCAMGQGTLFAAQTGDTDTGYARGSGTSLSCPLVSGTVALLLEAQPGASPVAVAGALKQTASRAVVPGPDNDYGWGSIRGLDALNLLPVAAPPAAPGAIAGSLRAWPNPSRGATTLRFALAGGDRARSVTILDAAGRRVRALEAPRTAEGDVRWDGRDAGGHRAASGLYFARLESERGIAVARLVHLR